MRATEGDDKTWSCISFMRSAIFFQFVYVWSQTKKKKVWKTYFSFSLASCSRNLTATRRFPNEVVELYSKMPSASATYTWKRFCCKFWTNSIAEGHLKKVCNLRCRMRLLRASRACAVDVWGIQVQLFVRDVFSKQIALLADSGTEIKWKLISFFFN